MLGLLKTMVNIQLHTYYDEMDGNAQTMIYRQIHGHTE